MNADSEIKGELFNEVLRSLSRSAFNYVVNNGIGNLDAFLSLHPATLPRVPLCITWELSRVQTRVNMFQTIVERILSAEDEKAADVFQAVLHDTLRVRAYNALMHKGVRNLEPFLALTPEDLRNTVNCGSILTGEVLHVQGKLKSLLPPPTPTRVEHGVDDPEPGSVLRKTLSDLFVMDDCALDALWITAGELWLSDVLDLTEADWAKLAAVAIYTDDTFDVLLAVTIGRWVEADISKQAFDCIVETVAALIEGRVRPERCRPTCVACDEPIVGDTDVAAIRGFRIDSFDVPQEQVRDLQTRGLLTWGDLTTLTERGVIETSGLCPDALRQIREMWRMRLHAPLASRSVSGLPLQAYHSYATVVEAFIGLTTSNPRYKTILLGRMGLLDGRKWTLDDLGKLIGLTRARIGQIEHKHMKRLKSKQLLRKLARLWLAVTETLRLAGGVCMITELAEQISTKLEWDPRPSDEALSSLLQVFDCITVDKDTGLVCDMRHPCLRCEVVVSALEGLFVEDKSERPLPNVAEALLSTCEGGGTCDGFNSSLSFSEGFICQVAQKTSQVLVEDGVVYRRDTWGARRGSRTQLVESILKDAGRPMHFSEVCEQAKKLLPNDKRVTQHNIYSWIGNSANLLLWDRGTYIHRELVEVPEGLIGEVESWLEHKLESNVPFVSVAGAYSAFERELMRAGVSSESALYSCLREAGDDALTYPRYPYVVPNRPGCERLPISIALEQYVLDTGGLVSFREIKAYAVDDLCIAEQMFAIHVYNVPNIVRAGKGAYIHVKNLKPDHGKLAAIVAHAATLVSVDGHVSVDRIFSDKRVSCLSAGIGSPQMLYAVLQTHGDDGIQTPGYPQVMSSNYQTADGGSKGVINEVVDYIALREGPCSFDELEQCFVEELGYNAGTVYNVIIRDTVVRYSQGSMIHIDTIEWADDKQRELEAQAQDALVKVRKAGRCYALINYLLEYHKLPDLAGGVVWTQTLLSELLVRGGRFAVLGSARNAFVAIPNGEGIETFEDLLYELLKINYDGACELDSFEEDMRESGIVQKRVTPGMLGHQKKVRISGHLIMLRELHDRA